MSENRAEADRLFDEAMAVAHTMAGYSRESMSGLKRLLDREMPGYAD